MLCPDLPDLHFEVKRCERLRLYDALDQARADGGADRLPVVAHRRNGHRWIAVLALEDLLAILRESSYADGPSQTTGVTA